LTPAPSDHQLLRRHMTAERAGRLEEVLAGRTDRLIVVGENLYDPHNFSAILRSAEAFGVQEVQLTGSCPSELNPDIAIGAERWLTLSREPDPEACMNALRNRGYAIAAAALVPGAVHPDEWDPPGRTALFVGNEHEGLSPAVLGGADVALKLPLAGFTRSLNVSVAAALLMSTLLRKRSFSRRGLPPERAEALRNEWARKAVEHSEVILRRMRLQDETAKRST